MPNWCDCELTVSGEKEEVEKFEEFAQSGDRVLDANKFIPYPEEYEKLDQEARDYEKWIKKQLEGMSPSQKRQFRIENPRPKDGYNQGGYHWCIVNWGTKWNFSEPYLGDIEDNENGRDIIYYFSTAWSPPEGLLDKMAEMFPKLQFDFRCYEGGSAFQADGFWTGGNREYLTYSDYHGPRGG
jgi:hypothetical protein